MSLFKVTPSNRLHRYNAPSIYVESSREEEAVKEAKTKTRLSDFNSWSFSAKEINNHKK